MNIEKKEDKIIDIEDIRKVIINVGILAEVDLV